MICDNLTVNENNHLCFAGQDTVLLAKKYKTPLYLMDENKIRVNINEYKKTLNKYFKDSYPLFASKSFSVQEIYKIAKEEGIGIDVVSSGEIFTAQAAGFDMSKAYFHGNNKTKSDVAFAFNNNVGFFVCDNKNELNLIQNEALKRDCVQNVLIRITPGIDPHTHKSISTGSVDSKFGVAIETGDAIKLIEYAQTKKNVNIVGLHCHIGSQIFEVEPYVQAVDIMTKFIAKLNNDLGIEIGILNLGGGFAVRYLESDPIINIDSNIKAISEELNLKCKEYKINVPAIRLEPGRSIVANAGLTLYTIGSIKKIKGFKNYVAIDGGMTDNPRFALYQSPYSVFIANKMNESNSFNASVVGCCCESGDIIQENVDMPNPKTGDILAVCTTGAYNYSMSSNYNRLLKPPVVFIKDGESRVVVKRETFKDLIKNEKR